MLTITTLYEERWSRAARDGHVAQGLGAAQAVASSPALGGIDGSIYTHALGMKNANQIVHIRVPRSLVREARHRAADLEISFAEFVRQALTLATQRSPKRRQVTP
ncbi:MAG: hypothetical protein KF718_02490 [Polyangiaceae bacterium]|nr:hypothetical protein [Polyangiaceae bacterium]